MMGVVPRKLWDERHENPAAIEAEFKGQKGRGWLTTWLPARAHDNGLFIAFANGVGPDVDEVRTGNAMVIDPFGRIINETWRADDVMVTADLDPSLLETNFGKAFIRTRRPELYGELAQPTGREVDVKISRFTDQGARPSR
jgi:predicted amidohydrolase